jgi:hypothetical protein
MANLGVTEASRHDFSALSRCDDYQRSTHSIRGMPMRRRTKIILAVIGVALVWPFAQIGLIAAQAQYYADGRPYCMDTSAGTGRYRPVSSLLELNGFNLHAPFISGSGSGSHGFMQWTFHAVLAISTGSAREWRNWSYWHQHFDQLTAQQARATGLYDVACQPETGFVLKLPFIAM